MEGGDHGACQNEHDKTEHLVTYLVQRTDWLKSSSKPRNRALGTDTLMVGFDDVMDRGIWIEEDDKDEKEGR